MIELPDINVLFALHFPRHLDHGTAQKWFDQVEGFATTPITELGFVRLLLNPVASGEVISPKRAISALSTLKTTEGAKFWPDVLDPDIFGRFDYALTGHRQVTDLHLLAIVADNNSRLVTLDTKIWSALRVQDRKYIHVIS